MKIFPFGSLKIKQPGKLILWAPLPRETQKWQHESSQGQGNIHVIIICYAARLPGVTPMAVLGPHIQFLPSQSSGAPVSSLLHKSQPNQVSRSEIELMNGVVPVFTARSHALPHLLHTTTSYRGWNGCCYFSFIKDVGVTGRQSQSPACRDPGADCGDDQFSIQARIRTSREEPRKPTSR